MEYDAVFEGGGVKGIGLAGAVCELERYGFTPANTAGTSAGAIVASLLAAGYKGAEIKDTLQRLDFRKFRQEDLLCKLGVFGKTLKILFKYGIYCSNYCEAWLTELLEEKGVRKFSDLKSKSGGKYRFQAVASDLGNHSLLILPSGVTQFGFTPDDFSVAKAVRMSISIPIYFEPYKVTDADGSAHYIADGGLLSNYPLWLFDEESKAGRTVFGFKLSNPHKSRHGCGRETCIDNLADYAKAIAATAMDAHDNYYVSTSSGDKQRTIFISTIINVKGREKNIGTTDFDITPEESEALFQNGADAARKFLEAGAWKPEAKS